MINPSIFIGEPIDFKNICKIYPPKVKDVVANLSLAAYLRLFTITEEDLREELKNKNISNVDNVSIFSFLLESCSESK
jgi:hypothetical protein